VARYYTESLDGRICEVVAQDETGLYSGAVCRIGADAPVLRTIQWRRPSMLWVKLPEWLGPREVCTTSKEYLECKRRVERNSWSETIASEMKEMPGTAEEIISAVMKQAGPDGICVVNAPAPVR
jgi:hypothetical protein